MTTFTATLRSRDGEDSIKPLRAALKVLRGPFGLKAIEVAEQQLIVPARRDLIHAASATGSL